MTVRRTFWILSIANWLLAVAVWSVSAYLGIAHPTSLFIPTTLFVIGIFAVLAGTLCWVVARFGRPPEPSAETGAEVTAAEATPAPAPAAATQVEASVAESAPAAATAAQSAPAAAIAAGAGVSTTPESASPASPETVTAPAVEPGSAAEQPLPAEAG